MTRGPSHPGIRSSILVLSSRGGFESLVGPVPSDLTDRFRFVKPRLRARVEASLPEARLVISKSYTRPEANRWIFAARRAGIPTLLLVDGPLEWSNLYSNPSLARLGDAANGLYEPIVHDAVATLGDAQRDWLAARNPGRGIEFMNYANRRILTPRPTGASAARPEFDFLLTTAKTAWFDEAERRALDATLRTCAAALEGGGHRICARIFDRGLRASIRRAAPSVHFETNGTFAETLERTQCVIGTSSSVLFEAMLHDRPTGLLDFRDRPLFYACGWLLDGAGDWDSIFSSMRAAEAAGMERQQRCLRAHLSRADFYQTVRRIERDGHLARPRPLDEADLAFESRALQASKPLARRFYDRFTRIPSAPDPAR